MQNSALLLIANLASWVPELILHNLMPIFTFIGSTLLRQHDDYSAQVVDKVRIPVSHFSLAKLISTDDISCRAPPGSLAPIKTQELLDRCF